MILPKDFPSFQTVAWWIKELQQFNPKAVVMLADAPQSNPGYMLSMYGDTMDNLKTKAVWIDVEFPQS